MTNAGFIQQVSESAMTLVKENPTRSDETTLQDDEYFALVLNTTMKSYLRNYNEYRGLFNYNSRYETYDFGIYKQLPQGFFYISKSYATVYNMVMPGRIVIVSVADLDKCLIL